MTVTDIITDESRPMTTTEIRDRRNDRRWRIASTGFIIAITITAVVVFANLMGWL